MYGLCWFSHDIMSSNNSSSSQQAAANGVPAPGTIPTLISPDGIKHIEWLKNVFGAEVKEIYYRDADKKEKVNHCSLAVNGGLLYMYDECTSQNKGDEAGAHEPGGFLCHMCLEDPKAVWSKAMANGSTAKMDLKMQSWGGLYGSFKDPFGFSWSVSKAAEKDLVPGVVPYLLSPSGECEKHIDWLKAAFKAEVKGQHHTDDNKVMHCDLVVNGGHIYLADGPPGEKPSGLMVHMGVSEPKALWETALKSDASVTMDLKVQFWGDLFGSFKDPFGFQWSVAQREKQPSKMPNKGVIPYLCSPDCEKHVEWIKKVMGGEVKETYRIPDGSKIMHCAMAVNGGFVYLADRVCTPDLKAHSDYKGDPQGFLSHLEVVDPSIIWKKAIGNGATAVINLEVQPWGGLFGTFKDPFGFHWGLMRVQN